MILYNILIIIAGFALLFVGAEGFVKGGVDIAQRLGIRTIIIGLVIVGFGTSTPELFICIQSAFTKASGIGLGNILGSNIANIFLALGIAAIIKPIDIAKSILKYDMVFILLSSIISYIFAFNGIISRIEGIVLILLFSGYMAYNIYTAKDKNSASNINTKKNKKKNIKSWLFLIGGVGITIFGADLVVDGGVKIAKSFGISELIIGLTIVAIGTSLPEVATTFVASLKNESDISIGNIVGSNVFNLLLILGLTVIIVPVPVENQSIRIDFPLMIFSVIILELLALIRLRIERWHGVLFILIYVGYISYLVKIAI